MVEKSAVKRIEHGDKKLAAHLARHIKTGHSCRYEADGDGTVLWEL